RAMMLSRLPQDLRGARVLDAGCGAGQLTAELATRGADVLAVDLSPKMIEIARARLPRSVAQRVRFVAGDMLSDGLGRFDAAMAMDSLIYYRAPDLVDAIDRLSARTDRLVFTLAPRTPALTAMWWAGQLFPRGDKSPTIIPHSLKRLRTRREIDWVGRVNRGFYISDCVKVQR
ncbi:MAG: magnesium protoporphyrin IX methyltransferase, partial [Pseudomonadota bacterium]